jgi:hypothetical protein
VSSGKLLELCRTSGSEARTFPEAFTELCAALYNWHLRLMSGGPKADKREKAR